MIYYAIKWFTIQLFDFVNNLLVPVEIFNQYQSGWQKKGAARESNPSRSARKFRLTIELLGEFNPIGGKRLKINMSQEP